MKNILLKYLKDRRKLFEEIREEVLSVVIE